MTSQIRGSNQAGRNISDAIAMVQTADGALREVSSIMQRMRELAVQGATETYSPADLLLMDTEYQQLEAEITRIVDQTKWNRMDLLNGDVLVILLVKVVYSRYNLVLIMGKH